MPIPPSQARRLPPPPSPPTPGLIASTAHLSAPCDCPPSTSSLIDSDQLPPCTSTPSPSPTSTRSPWSRCRPSVAWTTPSRCTVTHAERCRRITTASRGSYTPRRSTSSACTANSTPPTLTPPPHIPTLSPNHPPPPPSSTTAFPPTPLPLTVDPDPPSPPHRSAEAFFSRLLGRALQLCLPGLASLRPPAGRSPPRPTPSYTRTHSASSSPPPGASGPTTAPPLLPLSPSPPSTVLLQQKAESTAALHLTRCASVFHTWRAVVRERRQKRALVIASIAGKKELHRQWRVWKHWTTRVHRARAEADRRHLLSSQLHLAQATVLVQAAEASPPSVEPVAGDALTAALTAPGAGGDTSRAPRSVATVIARITRGTVRGAFLAWRHLARQSQQRGVRLQSLISGKKRRLTCKAVFQQWRAVVREQRTVKAAQRPTSGAAGGGDDEEKWAAAAA